MGTGEERGEPAGTDGTGIGTGLETGIGSGLETGIGSGLETGDETGDEASREVGPFGLLDGEIVTRADHARRLLTTPDGQEAINRLAALAARLVGASSAQVSVIDEDQVVVGGHGLDVGAVGSRTATTESLCSVTLDAGATVPIPDARADDRVRGMLSVTTGTVGSYLGVPLRVQGHVVGALCVFDPHPRDWSDDEVALLEQLAAPVLAELELAAVRSSYADDRRLWQLAVDAAGVGAFDWEIDSDRLRWDERLLDLFGLDRTNVPDTIGGFGDLVHPEDRERVSLALTQAIAACGAYAAEYRIVRPDGTLRWVAARGHAVPGPTGATQRLVGAAYDTTAVREGEARVARTLEAMPTAYFHLDRSWRFTYANPEARRLLGGIGSDVVGHVIWELFPDAVGSDFETHYRGAVALDEPRTFEAHYPAPLEGWYEVQCWPSPDGLSVYFNDVTQRHTSQDALEAGSRRTALLAEVTSVLGGTLDRGEAATQLAQLLTPGLGDWCLVTMVDGVLPDEPTVDPGWRNRLRDLGSWHADAGSRPLVAAYARRRSSALTDDSLVAQVLRTGAALVVAHDATSRILGALDPGPARDLCLTLAPESLAIMPLSGRGRVAGLVSVFRNAGRPPFDADELDQLAEVAERAGVALDNIYLYDRQRELADGLQLSLLTAPPVHDGAQVVFRYRPAADTAQVGGDWYDAFGRPGAPLTLVIGDVMGHDTMAAAAMGQLRGLVRGIAVTTDAGPADVLDRVDDAMGSLGVDTLATAVVARLEQHDDGDGARLCLSNAGHLPPALLTAAGVATLVTGTEPRAMLGLGGSADRDDTELQLAPGDTLLLYTDGLVERRGESLDVGLERLRSLLADPVAAELSLDALADLVLTRLAPDWNEDDIALVAVRVG